MVKVYNCAQMQLNKTCTYMNISNCDIIKGKVMTVEALEELL